MLKYVGLVIFVIMMAYVNDFVDVVHKQISPRAHCKVCEQHLFNKNGGTNLPLYSTKNMEYTP